MSLTCNSKLRFFILVLIFFNSAVRTNIFYYLKNLFFGEDYFKFDSVDSFHNTLGQGFVKAKDEGLSLSYSLIYYNFVLNLEKQCLLQSFPVDECQVLTERMKAVILNHIQPGNKGYKYVRIDQFFNMIFEESEENSVENNKIIKKLAIFFKGKDFEEIFESLKILYNNTLMKFMKYLDPRIEDHLIHLKE